MVHCFCSVIVTISEKGQSGGTGTDLTPSFIKTRGTKVNAPKGHTVSILNGSVQFSLWKCGRIFRSDQDAVVEDSMRLNPLANGTSEAEPDAPLGAQRFWLVALFCNVPLLSAFFGFSFAQIAKFLIDYANFGRWVEGGFIDQCLERRDKRERCNHEEHIQFAAKPCTRTHAVMAVPRILITGGTTRGSTVREACPAAIAPSSQGFACQVLGV